MDYYRDYILLLAIFTFSLVDSFAQLTSRDTSFIITQSSDSFAINMNGYLDAENTFSWDTTPNIYFIKFQPMVSVSITNIDTVPLKNPRLIINNRGRWFDLTSINNEIIEGTGTFNEKAKSSWKFIRNNRIHRIAVSPISDWGNPVQLLGIYGFGQCNNISSLITDLPVNERTYFHLPTNYGHAVSEIKIGTDIGIIDGDLETFYLKNDNQTLASRQDISKDRNLIRRSTHYGKQYRFSDITNKLISSLYRIEPSYTPYATTAVPNPPYNGQILDFVLRPGESILYEWKDGLYNYSDYGNNAVPSEIGNGKFIYRTNFKNASLPVIVNGSENIVSDGNSPNIHSDLSSQKGIIVIKITSPFTIVNGFVKGWFYKLTPNDSVELFFSKDSANWISKTILSGTGNLFDSIPMYNEIQPMYSGAPTFYYYLKFVFTPTSANTDCGMDSLEVQTTFQVNRFFMPYLKLGLNQIEYSDQNNDSTNVRINLRWQETTSNTPPGKILSPVFPVNGSMVDSLKFNFIWNDAIDIDGDTINNYEFELSDMPDMKYPLSPVFNQYTNTKPLFSHSYWQGIQNGNRTMINLYSDNKNQILPTQEVLEETRKYAEINNVTPVAIPSFSIPENGLLNAGQTYYWRVRARDARSAWGMWSDIWSFTADGPMPVINYTKQIINDSLRLSWNKNVSGKAPSYYEIHSSNEWLGFTPDSSTLMDTTSAETYTYLLNSDSIPDIFYRVIAIDSNGKKSGVSEVIQLTYPYYFGKIDTVKTDSLYNLVLNTPSLWFPYYNNSLTPGVAEDTIRKTMLYLPPWLTFDSATNIISGNPDSSVVSQMLYDTLLSTIIYKMEGKSSFPHLYSSYVNKIPSFKNTQLIRLKSSYKNSAPYNFFKDTSRFVATNYYEQQINGFDADTLYGDTVSLQVILKPTWLNDINLSPSSIKLSGTPGILDTGNFIIIIQSCDKLNECTVDSLFMFVKMPYLNIISDTINLCNNDTLILFTKDEPGYLLQWFKDSVPLNGYTDDSLIISVAGKYKIQLIAPDSSCAFSNEVTIIIDTNNATTSILYSGALCKGDTVIMKNNYSFGFDSLQWFMNDSLLVTSNNIDSLIITYDGVYQTSIVTLAGCKIYSKKDTIQFININSLVLSASTDTSTLCEGDSFYLIYSNLNYYATEWFRNDTLLQQNNGRDSLLVIQDGVYYIQIADSNMCTEQSSKNIINFKDTIHPLLNFLNDTLYVNISGNSYQWFYQGNTIAGATQSYFAPDSNGSYFCQVILTNGCDVTSDTIVITTTSVDDSFSDNNFMSAFSDDQSLYIQINNPLTGNIRLRLINTYGATIEDIVFLKTSNTHSLKINTSRVSSGMFIIILQNNQIAISKKVIKPSGY